MSKIFHRRFTSNLLTALILIASASCVSPSRNSPQNENPPATPEEIAKWRKEHGFAVATEDEIAQAKSLEVRFKNNRAISPDEKLKVVFRAGELVGDRVWGASATSVYQLQDTSGRVLLSAPSRVVKRTPNKDSNDIQLVWFSKDGSKVLIYEYLMCGLGPAPHVVLFYQNPERENRWAVCYPDLGGTHNAPYWEGDRAECRGILGNQILIRNTCEGVSKIDINRLKETYPFPWTEG
jgi:hypothetical protein